MYLSPGTCTNTVSAPYDQLDEANTGAAFSQFVTFRNVRECGSEAISDMEMRMFKHSFAHVGHSWLLLANTLTLSPFMK